MTDSRRATPPMLDRAWTERPLWQAGLAAALVASATNVALYMVARAVGVPMELTEIFEDDFERMPALNMVWGTLLEGGVAGIALAAGCRRWATRPRACFVVLAVIGTVASFGLPIASDGSTATIVVLSISHIVAALVIVPALALTLQPRRPPIRSSPRDAPDDRADRQQPARAHGTSGRRSARRSDSA